MSHTKVEAIYAIRHKESGEFVRANGKGCWMSVSGLKSSWNSSRISDVLVGCTWKTQAIEDSEYEIVDTLDELSFQQQSFKKMTAGLHFFS